MMLWFYKKLDILAQLAWHSMQGTLALTALVC